MRPRRTGPRSSTRCSATSTTCSRSTHSLMGPVRTQRRTDFADFMDKHGDFFPENPQNIDELMDSLAERSAAAQRMLNSMTPEQRAELMQLSQQAFGSPELMQQLARMDANLQALRPDLDWGSSESFGGEQGLGPRRRHRRHPGPRRARRAGRPALPVLRRRADRRRRPRRAGPPARRPGRRRREDPPELEKHCATRGYLKRGSDGELRLSPKAMRQLGKALLRDVATRMSRTPGPRESRNAGAGRRALRCHEAWEFGDTEPWDVTRTITNAVLRDGERSAAG